MCHAKFRVSLTQEERGQRDWLNRSNQTDANVSRRAGTLLLCDRGPEGWVWSNARVAEPAACSERTVEAAKRCFEEEGV